MQAVLKRNVQQRFARQTSHSSCASIPMSAQPHCMGYIMLSHLRRRSGFVMQQALKLKHLRDHSAMQLARNQPRIRIVFYTPEIVEIFEGERLRRELWKAFVFRKWRKYARISAERRELNAFLKDIWPELTEPVVDFIVSFTL